MKRDQRGYSIIVMLLMLIIIAIIGFVGWYVWQSKNNTEKVQQDSKNAQSTPTKSNKKSASKPGAVDPTSDWVAYSNAPGQYSLKHPKTWVQATNPDLCNPELFLVGANESSVGKCATESFGQMNVSSQTGDSSSEQALSSGYIDITKTSATVAGVTGSKYSGKASGQQSADDAIGGYADGTKVVKYVFVTNGRTYTATYIQQSTYPDVLSDFELMVTKTLKFSS